MDTYTVEPITQEKLSRRLDEALDAVFPLTADWDRGGNFVEEGLDGLRHCGALAAPLPPDLGGLGLGTTAAGARGLLDALRRIAHVSLSLGRVYENHVTALRLIHRHGTRMQSWHAAQDARAGHLFAIWTAEARESRVRLEAGVLRGSKTMAAAAHQTTRALITAEIPGEGEQLVLVQLRPAQGRDGACFDLHGIRSAGIATVDFDGIAVDADACIGVARDCGRGSDAAMGSWRTLAVQLGGLEALVAAIRTELTARHRHTDLHQLARFGQLLIAEETARLWITRAADIADADSVDPASAVSYLKLARVAVESACLEAISLAQRAAGLAAFVCPGQLERIVRDLATYLRQPGLDHGLDEAATHFLTRA